MRKYLQDYVDEYLSLTSDIINNVGNQEEKIEKLAQLKREMNEKYGGETNEST